MRWDAVLLESEHVSRNTSYCQQTFLQQNIPVILSVNLHSGSTNISSLSASKFWYSNRHHQWLAKGCTRAQQSSRWDSLIMRPSSLGGGRILRRTLSVRLSVRPVIVFVYSFYSRTVLRANIQNRKTSVFAYGPASRMYFSARTEGRISYEHLGRTNLFLKERAT